MDNCKLWLRGHLNRHLGKYLTFLEETKKEKHVRIILLKIHLSELLHVCLENYLVSTSEY